MIMRMLGVFIVLCGSIGVAQTVKPKVAMFPLGGSAAGEVREKVGFSFRAKLDREGTYEPIDGPTMLDVAGSQAPTFSTSPEEIEKLASANEASTDAIVLLWGEMDGSVLKLHLLDKRAKPISRDIEKHIDEPTDLRFAVEQVLETLPGIKPFSHPVETSVQDDPAARAMFAANPNLVQHGDFEGDAASDAWDALLRSEKYHPPTAAELPEADKVAITKNPDGEGHVLAMQLSKDVAESNGLACISSPISIEPNTRYRLQFRYKSGGPVLHVFVKGYGLVDGEDRELYRRQVPPGGKTDGQWITITDDLNPQHGHFAVTSLRVDLYAYLKPGSVMFDDVVLKAVGLPSHIVKDDAIKTSAK